MTELQSELQARTRDSLALQAEVQRLQFRLQQRDSAAIGTLEAERGERARLCSELGQARLLAAARGRQLEGAQADAVVVKEAAEREAAQVRCELTQALAALKQAQLLLEARTGEAELLRREVATAEKRADEADREAEGLRAQVTKLHSEVADLRLQVCTCVIGWVGCGGCSSIDDGVEGRGRAVGFINRACLFSFWPQAEWVEGALQDAQEGRMRKGSAVFSPPTEHLHAGQAAQLARELQVNEGG